MCHLCAKVVEEREEKKKKKVVVVVVVVVVWKKTIPLPGGAELVKLAMSTNTGSVQPTGSATVLRLQ